MKLTQLDIKLIKLMSALLVAVIAYLGFIKPALAERTELDTSLETARLEQSVAQDAIALLASRQTSLETAKNEYEKISESFYPLMDSRGIDDMVTGRLLGAGVQVKSLILSNSDALQSVDPFAQSGGGQPKSVYICRASIRAEGDEASLWEAVNEFARDDGSSGIESYQLTIGDPDETDGVKRGTLDMSLLIYMCGGEGE